MTTTLDASSLFPKYCALSRCSQKCDGEISLARSSELQLTHYRERGRLAAADKSGVRIVRSIAFILKSPLPFSQFSVHDTACTVLGSHFRFDYPQRRGLQNFRSSGYRLVRRMAIDNRVPTVESQLVKIYSSHICLRVNKVYLRHIPYLDIFGEQRNDSQCSSADLEWLQS